VTEEEQHELVADIVKHLLERIKIGDQVFAILSFKHDEERDTMRATLSTVRVGFGDEDERMEAKVTQIVEQFMNENHPKWGQ
jgi:2-keto-3-deoxy-L-rhamnonate aldolase RhmA